MRFGQLNRLGYPEIQEYTDKIQQFKKSGEFQLMWIEQNKLNKFKKVHGIYMPLFSRYGMVFQGLTLAVWAGLIQRFSFNVEDYPEMITGGFLWFKDLSITDPYFILPMINSFFIFLNIYVNIVFI
jgi:hypothetical protein